MSRHGRDGSRLLVRRVRGKKLPRFPMPDHLTRLPSKDAETLRKVITRMAGADDREFGKKRQSLEPWMRRRDYMQGWKQATTRKYRGRYTKWGLRNHRAKCRRLDRRRL